MVHHSGVTIKYKCDRQWERNLVDKHMYSMEPMLTKLETADLWQMFLACLYSALCVDARQT